jgi:hypothetical protein
MQKRFWKYVAVLLPGAVLLCWLFMGVYKDRKFGNHRLFVKNSPTLKFSFYAPLGESEFTLNDLDPQRSQEEVMYRKYVEEGGGYRRSIPLGW